MCAIVRRRALALREGWDAPVYEHEYRADLVAMRPVVPVRFSTLTDAWREMCKYEICYDGRSMS